MNREDAIEAVMNTGKTQEQAEAFLAIMASAFRRRGWAEGEPLNPDEVGEKLDAFLGGELDRAKESILHPHVAGFCPACGQELLVLTDTGHIICALSDCPNQGAVDDLLDDRETGHVVVFGETEFTIRHPLIERLDDALLDCDLHRIIAGLDGPPVQPGRYRARHIPGEFAVTRHSLAGQWVWELLSDA